MQGVQAIRLRCGNWDQEWNEDQQVARRHYVPDAGFPCPMREARDGAAQGRFSPMCRNAISAPNHAEASGRTGDTWEEAV